jgi:hypothetical protein
MDNDITTQVKGQQLRVVDWKSFSVNFHSKTLILGKF